MIDNQRRRPDAETGRFGQRPVSVTHIINQLDLNSTESTELQRWAKAISAAIPAFKHRQMRRREGVPHVR